MSVQHLHEPQRLHETQGNAAVIDDGKSVTWNERRVISDEELTAEVERLLRSSGHGGLREVRVSVSQGHVTLDGRVRSYFLKQVAHATVRATDGIKSVTNDLVVC